MSPARYRVTTDNFVKEFYSSSANRTQFLDHSPRQRSRSGADILFVSRDEILPHPMARTDEEIEQEMNALQARTRSRETGQVKSNSRQCRYRSNQVTTKSVGRDVCATCTNIAFELDSGIKIMLNINTTTKYKMPGRKPETELPSSSRPHKGRLFCCVE